ncbi:MAG: trigger factor [Gallionellaceae bacterium]
MASVETLGALERRLSSFISQQQIRGEVESRLKRLGRTARVRGFRPGKVPLKIIQQQYGAQVQQEVLGDALQRSFDEMARLNSLRVAGSPNFEIKSAEPGTELIEFSATFEVYPDIVFGDISKEQVERLVYDLDDADVDNAIMTLRKQRAVYQPVDRAAQKEDQVRIDFTGKLDGEAFEGGDARNFKVILGAGSMLPDFESAIIGMKAGESKSFDMTFPDDYYGKNVAGKQVNFTVTLHAVEAPILPELDAEFIKSLGVPEGDLEKFRAEVLTNLKREADRRLKVRNKQSAMDLLLKVTQIDVPRALLDMEVQQMMQQAMDEMRTSGVKIPKGASLSPDAFVDRAQRRVRLGLILAELIRQNNLKAEPDQIRTLVEDYAQSFEDPEEVVKWHYGDPSRLRDAEIMALEDNVVVWVMGTVKVTDRHVKFSELMVNN